MSLFFLAFHESLHGEFDSAMQHFEDSLVELRLAPGSLPWAELRAGQAFGAGLQGRLQEAATWIEEASKVFEAVGDPYWTMIGHVYRASVAFLAGDVSVARAEQDAAAAAATHVDSLMTALSGSYESLVLMLEGRTDEVEAAAEPWLAQVGYLGPTVGSGLEAGLRGAIALARLAAGDGDGAVASAKEAAAVARQANTPAYSPVALIAAGAVFLGADDEQAEQAAHDVLAAAASAGANATAPAGLELLAAVARRQESRPEACRLLAAAARAREVMGTVPSRWGVDVAEEIATLRAEMDGDAFEKAWQEGAALDLADAVAYAQRGRGERKRPSHGWAALTPTEEQVAGLVAEGLSNPDIAERLFISRRTVASHLTHVFAKLNIRTRSELTAAVLRPR
jgi:DNA-binding CsgD family transcriptional regulator